MINNPSKRVPGRRVGSLQHLRGLPALAPQTFSVEERDTRHWLHYLKQFSQWLRFYQAGDHTSHSGASHSGASHSGASHSGASHSGASHSGASLNWGGFIPDELITDEANLNALLVWLEDDNSNHIINNRIKTLAARPDLALILVFLKLLRHPRKMFADLTERHLLYYYRDILGLSEKPAVPDQVHLQVLLNPEAEPLVLPAGTRFEAGNNLTGEARYYRLEQPTGINHAQIQTLRSLSLNRNGDNVGFIRTDLIDQTAGLDYPEADTLTFGENEITDTERQQHPATGFVIGSPLLWLSEGIRTITLNFDEAFVSDVIRLGITPASFLSLFSLSISTEEGMITLDNHEFTQISSTATTTALTLTITLDSLFAPISRNPEPVHRRLQSPYIQFSVLPDNKLPDNKLPDNKLPDNKLPDNNGRLQRYELLRRLKFEKIGLSVDVKGLSQLTLRNDQGLLDPGGPMELFGGRPLPNTRVQFSHPELVIKPLTSLTLNPQWNSKPADLQSLYQPYQTYLRATSGNSSLQWPQHTLSLGSPYSNTPPVSLFPAGNTIHQTLTNPEGQIDTPLYPAGLQWNNWQQVPQDTPDPRDWPLWYSLQLGADDFGHTIYSAVSGWHSQSYIQGMREYPNRLASWHQQIEAWNTEATLYAAYQQQLAEHQKQRSLWLAEKARDQLKDRFTVIATGGNAGQNRNVYDQFGRIVNTTVTDDVNVSVWDLAANNWIDHTSFDLADSSSADDALNDYLNNLSPDKTVAIYSGYHGMHGSRHHSNGLLPATIEHFGGTYTGFTQRFDYHHAYLLIGRKGLGAGNGFEQVSDNADSFVQATLSRGSGNQLDLTSIHTSSPNYETVPNPGPEPQPPAAVSDPGPKPVQPIEPAPVEVKEPWTPLVDSFTIDYTTTANITVPTAGVDDLHQLLHVHPLGSQAIRDAEEQTLLPALDDNGYLYIGIRQPPTGGSIDLQFQLAPVDSDANLDDAVVEWSYLANNRWRKFITNNQEDSGQRAAILADNTNDLVDSGIIRFGLEPEMTRDNGFPGANQLWLRAAINSHYAGAVPWSQLRGVHSQAVVVRFDDSDITPDHLPATLPAETINALEESSIEERFFAAIESVVQSWPSFGGRPSEATSAFTTRVSERLRHRGRALTAWDYEQLVLEEFPDILLAHCLRGSDAYGIRLLIVPRTDDPELLKPRASRDIRNRVKRYLQPIMPPQVQLQGQLQVEPPVFQEVRFDITLTFHPEYDPGVVLQNLNQELVAMLNPWKAGSVVLKPELAVSDIVAFVASRPYVELALKVLVETIVPDSTRQEWMTVTDGVVRPTRNDIILVPAARHTITALPSGSKLVDGIGLMEVEYDFEIPDTPITGISHMVIGGDGQPGADGGARPAFTVTC